MISDDGTLESRCGTAATAPPGLSSHLVQSLLPARIHEYLLCTLSQPRGTGMLRSPRHMHTKGALSLSGKWSYWPVAESRAVQDMRMTAWNEEPPLLSSFASQSHQTEDLDRCSCPILPHSRCGRETQGSDAGHPQSHRERPATLKPRPVCGFPNRCSSRKRMYGHPPLHTTPTRNASRPSVH